MVNDPAYDQNVFERILNELIDLFVVHIELVLPYSFEEFLDVPFLVIHQRISKVIYLGAPKNEHYISITEEHIILSIQNTFDPKEIIDPDNFSVNTLSFVEANKYNIGLNRKLCIDKDGYILNYLGHAPKFGNIKNDKISEVINRDDFRLKWNITNDQIEKCKDCQFRFCCVSN